MKIIKAIAVIVLAFAAVGCATPRMTEVPETMTLKAPPQLPPPVMKPEPPKAEELPAARERGRFSLSVRDADVRDVFLLLSKDSGINIIADKDVTGKISIDFTNLELPSALYAITRQLGYTFRMDKGFIRVTRPILETRTFRVNYITGKRTSTSTMNAAISTGSTTTTSSSGTNINISASAGNSSTGGASSSTSNQGSVTVTTTGTADFWKELKRSLEVIVFGDTKGGGDSDGGFSRGDDKTGKKLIINDLAGIVQVSDYSDNLERIEDFLKDVEQSARKQVMIQAHIIEVALNDDFKYGINWDHIFRLPGDITIGMNQSMSPFTATSPSNFRLKIGHAGGKANDVIDAMKEQGQVNVLSSPKVSTMNNQKAVIKLTTKEVSWVTSSYANDNVIVSNTTPQIDEIGLFLDVTPQIDDIGIITMQIHPSISEKKGDSVIETKEGKNTKPIIDTREADTMIKTRNGQTIVIAGLITDKINDTTKRVPILGDIPIIGAAFKQVDQTKRKSELVILLTPYVLTDQSVEDIRKEHEDRFKKAGRSFEATPVLPFNVK